MLFILDQDVDVAVAKMLRHQGHTCHTAEEIGLSDADDDDLSVYADEHKGVVVTHDREFSQRRRKNAYGWHLQLRCVEWSAAELLEERLDEVLHEVESRAIAVMALSPAGLIVQSGAWT